MPGHHFQLTLRNENTTLSPFRKGTFYTTFIEGWAEYASDLAGEMGMYADPYDRAGRLSMDPFLSSRLVVDTGMNALGWSRELRKRAQERLGAAFDVRQFHDYVLEGGPMPLSVLEAHLACLGEEKHLQRKR